MQDIRFPIIVFETNPERTGAWGMALFETISHAESSVEPPEVIRNSVAAFDVEGKQFEFKIAERGKVALVPLDGAQPNMDLLVFLTRDYYREDYSGVEIDSIAFEKLLAKRQRLKQTSSLTFRCKQAWNRILKFLIAQTTE